MHGFGVVGIFWEGITQFSWYDMAGKDINGGVGGTTTMMMMMGGLVVGGCKGCD